MVKRQEDSLGPAAVRASTGRDLEQWRDLLALAGAMVWSHNQTARWLVETQGLDGWWAQAVTVDFEQSRKGRLPGQQSDGSFATSATRTIPGDRLGALASVTNAVEAVHGEPHALNLAAKTPIVRWRLTDGSRLAASAGNERATGTPIALTCDGLTTHAQVADAKAHLIELLESARD